MSKTDNIICNIEEMDLTKLSKSELLVKCEELGFTKCKSKNKEELIILINGKNSQSKTNIIFVEEPETDVATNEIDLCQQKEKEPVVAKLSKEELKKNKEKMLEEIDELNTESFINETISLYCGDCIVKMADIPDDSVDLVLCDLPYGTTKCKWDTIIDLKECNIGEK